MLSHSQELHTASSPHKGRVAGPAVVQRPLKLLEGIFRTAGDQILHMPSP
jgi:hypothetical protein